MAEAGRRCPQLVNEENTEEMIIAAKLEVEPPASSRSFSCFCFDISQIQFVPVGKLPPTIDLAQQTAHVNRSIQPKTCIEHSLAF